MPSSKPARLLLLASYISQSGSHLLTIAMAAFVLAQTGSPVLSASVFVAAFLPSILLSAHLGAWIDQKLCKATLVAVDGLAIIATLLCGICVVRGGSLFYLLAIIAFRSLTSFSCRAAINKWLKLVTPAAEQASVIKIYFLSFFLSTVTSGVLAGVILARHSIYSVIAVDVGTYLVAIALYFFLPALPLTQPIPQSHSISLAATVRDIFERTPLRNAFLLVVFSQTILQGAYSVLVSYLPIQQFRLGIAGIGSFQIAASIGIILGFVMNWKYPAIFRNQTVRTVRWPMLLVLLTAGFALVAAVGATSVTSSCLSFLLMNLGYELIWLHGSSEFFSESPKTDTARFQFVLNASAAGAMSLLTLLYSLALSVSTSLFISLFSVCVLAAVGCLSIPKSTDLLNEVRV